MLKNYYYYKRTISLTLIRRRGDLRRNKKKGVLFISNRTPPVEKEI